MRFSLEQFADVFQIRDAAGRPYVLVGGQAVNYWAERYLPVEPALRELLPFTSEDIDFRGNREDVQRIADQLKQPAVYPHKIAMTALAGMVPFRIGGVDCSIEIVRRIPGVAAAAVDALAVEAEWAGRRLRVLDPISLLAGKLELALTLSQTKRRDAEHVGMLIFCVRGFLREGGGGRVAGEGLAGSRQQSSKTVSVCPRSQSRPTTGDRLETNLAPGGNHPESAAEAGEVPRRTIAALESLLTGRVFLCQRCDSGF